MAIEKLKEFEKAFDGRIKDLPLFKALPVRAVLSYLHVIVDGFLQDPATASPRLRLNQQAIGESIAGKLSYLMPLLAQCNRKGLGADAADVISAAREIDPDLRQMRSLIEYAQYCAVMPDVWKGNYQVEVDNKGGFALKHISEEQSKFETIDIVLSELALTHLSESPPSYAKHFDAMALEKSLDALVGMAKRYRDFYEKSVVDHPILSDEGYLAATGVTRREFERFRASLLGIAATCIGLSKAVTRRRRLHPTDLSLEEEFLEWVSVCWKGKFFQVLLTALSDLTGEQLDQLLPLFSLDFRADEPNLNHANDGYCPPLAWIEGAVIFNPSLLQASLASRNVLYALNRIDKGRFDSLVSSHMEPELLKSAIASFEKFHGALVVPNVNWKHGTEAGELDLLVYSAHENVALHIQAKAAIPPEGARMVAALEKRIAEGVSQLQRFRKLPQDVIDSIIASQTGTTPKNVEVLDVILTRSCCGTYRVWSKLIDVAVVNLSLLNAVQRQSASMKHKNPLKSFPQSVSDEVARVLKAIKPKWTNRAVTWEGTSFSIPELEYDRRVMDRERTSMGR